MSLENESRAEVLMLQSTAVDSGCGCGYDDPRPEEGQVSVFKGSSLGFLEGLTSSVSVSPISRPDCSSDNTTSGVSSSQLTLDIHDLGQPSSPHPGVDLHQFSLLLPGEARLALLHHM